MNLFCFEVNTIIDFIFAIIREKLIIGSIVEPSSIILRTMQNTYELKIRSEIVTLIYISDYNEIDIAKLFSFIELLLGRCLLGRCLLGRCLLGRCLLRRCLLRRPQNILHLISTFSAMFSPIVKCKAIQR